MPKKKERRRAVKKERGAVNGELTVLAYISTGSSIRSVLMCTLGFEPSTNNCFHVYIVYYANVALRFGVPAVPFVFPTFATCLCEHASRCCCACTRACIRRDAVGKGQRGQGSLSLSCRLGGTGGARALRLCTAQSARTAGKDK